MPFVPGRTNISFLIIPIIYYRICSSGLHSGNTNNIMRYFETDYRQCLQEGTKMIKAERAQMLGPRFLYEIDGC